MAATAALALAALIAAAIALSGSPGGGIGTRSSCALNAREVALVIAAGLVWGCPNAGFAVLLGFAPIFFVDQGMSADLASVLVSGAAFATVPTGPVGGWLLGRLRRPLQGIALGIAITSVATALLTLDIPPAVLLVAAGLSLGAIAGPIVALPAAVIAPERRAVGMGVFWLAFFVPMTLLPPLAGLARDLTRTAAAPLEAAALFTALALLALIAFVSVRRPEVAAAEI